MTEEILSAVSSEVFSVWFLIGAALVFILYGKPLQAWWGQRRAALPGYRAG